MPLRPYQIEPANQGLAILQQYHVLYLAGEMRTGKSFTSMWIADTYGALNVLFLTKKNAIPDVQKNYDSGGFRFRMVVINYEKLAAFQDHDQDGKPLGFRADDFASQYIQPDLVICDEAHALGQYPVAANKVKQVQKISLLLPVIFLSGTPSPESYSQLYHQFKVSSFSPFLPWKTFYLWAKGCKTPTDIEGEYVDLPGFVAVTQKKFKLKGQVVNDYSNANKELIDTFTKHLFITMTQQEAEFEQVVEDIIISVVMQPSTHALAKRLIKDRIVRAQDGTIIMGDTPAKLQQKLHQIYSGTVIAERVAKLVEGDTVVNEPRTFDTSKADFIKGLFAGKKIAILYVYRAEFAALLFAYGADKITDNAEEFAMTDKIYVNQIRSAREGVDLSPAEALVMYNIEFSALSYMQGRQRIQAKDRATAARVYWVFAVGGIEEKIFERVRNKLDYTTEYFKKDYL